MKLQFALLALSLAAALHAEPAQFDIRSVRSGAWSDAATWGGAMPKAGDRVQVRAGHSVVYDVESDTPIRMVHVGGKLSFSREKNTRLEVGLLRVTPGDTCDEEGFDCHDDAAAPAGGAVPVLEMGTADAPIPAGVRAVVRLRYFEGMNKETLPAIVACSGRWDVHGAPMARTWLKLGATSEKGAREVALVDAPAGWRVGDRVIVTGSLENDYVNAMKKAKGGYAGATEERLITAISGKTVTLDAPLEYQHLGEGITSSEAANLSRNVIVESAEPGGVRGHTMYHRDCTGGISYAEFRHLGKAGVLGKYAIHFHLVRDTMRGSGVTGASIWDSDNRWITVHGTDGLLVRDCVGYRSRGHGFFLEDATEQWNVFDRNLAVQAIAAKRLPKQALPFDPNDGAGFWWANGRNTFTRNVACENDEYGFRFELRKASNFDPVLRIRGTDGEPVERDVRTLPFFRFEDNESHTEGLYSFNFGDDKNGEIHGDRGHPFIVRNLRAWETHYVLRPNVQYFLCDTLTVKNAVYGVYHPDYDAHVYRDLDFDNVNSEPINRGHDDESIQYGDFTYERLALRNCRIGRDPLIQLACTSPREGVAGHFKDLVIENSRSQSNVVDLGGGPRNDKLEYAVAYYFHGYPAADRTTRVVSAKFAGAEMGEIAKFTGRDVRAEEKQSADFPQLLAPVDDLAPFTLVTSVRRTDGGVAVRGVSHDNGKVASVSVNGKPAEIISQQAGVADWTITLAATTDSFEATARDEAGNDERWPHRVVAAKEIEL